MVTGPHHRTGRRCPCQVATSSILPYCWASSANAPLAPAQANGLPRTVALGCFLLKVNPLHQQPFLFVPLTRFDVQRSLAGRSFTRLLSLVMTMIFRSGSISSKPPVSATAALFTLAPNTPEMHKSLLPVKMANNNAVAMPRKCPSPQLLHQGPIDLPRLVKHMP